MRWLMLVIALMPAAALAEQDVYLDPALRGIEVYLPRGVQPQTPFLSEYEVDLIRTEARKVSFDLRDDFGPRFKFWKSTWANGVASMDNIEYDLLARMGRPIVPLIIEMLLEEENSPALILYDHILPLEWYVGTPPDDNSPPPVAQRVRALKTVRRWLVLARKATYDRDPH